MASGKKEFNPNPIAPDMTTIIMSFARSIISALIKIAPIPTVINPLIR